MSVRKSKPTFDPRTWEIARTKLYEHSEELVRESKQLVERTKELVERSKKLLHGLGPSDGKPRSSQGGPRKIA